MNRIVFALIIAVMILSAGLFAASTGNEQSGVKKFVFDESRIEGKIRRPQLVLIKADQRPEFDPMVVQSLGRTGNIAGAVEKSILEKSPYNGAFSFRNKRIINLIP